MGDRVHLQKLIQTAGQHYNATRRSYLSRTIVSGIGNIIGNQALVLSVFLVCLLSGGYVLLLHVQIPNGLLIFRNPTFETNQFASRFLDVFSTGKAFSSGGLLALGLVPLLPFRQAARMQVRDFGAIRPRYYLFVLPVLFTSALILKLWFPIETVNISTWSNVGGLVILMIGGIIVLNVDSYLHAAARFGVLELNGLVYFCLVSYELIAGLELTTGIDFVLIVLILLVPVGFITFGMLQSTVNVAYMGRGWRRAVQGSIHSPLLSGQLMGLFIVFYLFGWGISALLINASGGGSNLTEWSLISLGVSLGLIGALSITLFEYRHFLHSSAPKQIARRLDARMFLIHRITKDKYQSHNESISPGAQTEGYLFDLEEKRLRYTLSAAIGTIAAWLVIAMLGRQGTLVLIETVQPLSYTIAILLAMKLLGCVRVLLRQQEGDLFSDTSVSRSLNSVWDNIRTVLNDLERQGFDISVARRLLSRGVESGWIERLKIIRKLYSLLDPATLSPGNSNAAGRALKARVIISHLLIAVLQTVLVAGFVVLFMRILGSSLDVSSQWGLVTGIGFVLLQEIRARWAQDKTESQLLAPTLTDRAQVCFDKAFLLHKGSNPNYEDAALQYHKALKLFAVEQELERFRTFSNLAICARDQAHPNMEEAAFYFRQALDLILNLNLPSERIQTLTNLASCMLKNPGEVDAKASKFANEAFELAHTLKHFQLMQAAAEVVEDVNRAVSKSGAGEACGTFPKMLAVVPKENRGALLYKWGDCLLGQPAPKYVAAGEKFREAADEYQMQQEHELNIVSLYKWAYCSHSGDNPDLVQAAQISQQAFDKAVGLPNEELVGQTAYQLYWLLSNPSTPDTKRAINVFLRAMDLSIEQKWENIYYKMRDSLTAIIDESPNVHNVDLSVYWVRAVECFGGIRNIIGAVIEFDLETKYSDGDKWASKAEEILDDANSTASLDRAYLALRCNNVGEAASALEGGGENRPNSRIQLMMSLVLFLQGREDSVATEIVTSDASEADYEWVIRIGRAYFLRYDSDRFVDYSLLLEQSRKLARRVKNEDEA